jgi:NADPH:quinone reductase
MVKAVRIHTHGGTEVMRFEDIELPRPARGEVRIRHTAIALNFSDINIRRGGFYQKEPLPMPIVLGNEAAGVVSALGEGASGMSVGDRVGYCGVGSNFSSIPARMRRSETCPQLAWSSYPTTCPTFRLPRSC